jgi:hypothetical protein
MGLRMTRPLGLLLLLLAVTLLLVTLLVVMTLPVTANLRR